MTKQVVFIIISDKSNWFRYRNNMSTIKPKTFVKSFSLPIITRNGWRKWQSPDCRIMIDCNDFDIWNNRYPINIQNRFVFSLLSCRLFDLFSQNYDRGDNMFLLWQCIFDHFIFILMGRSLNVQHIPHAKQNIAQISIVIFIALINSQNMGATWEHNVTSIAQYFVW